MIWRFLNTGFARGDYNMALDAALALGGFQSLPTLRVFRWRPACISLGHHQNAAEIDLQKCEADGVDVVRRPTAGRAILHAEELTYSVVVPAGHPWYQMLPLDFYRRISEAIAQGLQLLGAEIEFAPGDKLYHEGRPLRLACFASSARNEIIANGRKVVGSAQRRFRAGVLQHGSILLQCEHERLVDYLVGTPAEVAAEYVRLKEHTTTLADILRKPASFEEAMHALRRGFEKMLRIEFVEEEPLTEEIEWAGRGSERYRIHTTNQQEKTVCTSLESC
jgi:lipoate-protein ligase A